MKETNLSKNSDSTGTEQDKKSRKGISIVNGYFMPRLFKKTNLPAVLEYLEKKQGYSSADIALMSKNNLLLFKGKDCHYLVFAEQGSYQKFSHEYADFLAHTSGEELQSLPQNDFNELVDFLWRNGSFTQDTGDGGIVKCLVLVPCPVSKTNTAVFKKQEQRILENVRSKKKGLINRVKDKTCADRYYFRGEIFETPESTIPLSGCLMIMPLNSPVESLLLALMD